MHFNNNASNSNTGGIFNFMLNNPNLITSGLQVLQYIHTTETQNKELVANNQNLEMTNNDFATSNRRLLDRIATLNERINILLKRNQELEQQVKNENGSSEKNGNLESTALAINNKDKNADEKSNLPSINKINEIEKTPQEALIDATKEIYLLKKSSETLNNDLKKAKDQNNKLINEKKELSKCNKYQQYQYEDLKYQYEDLKHQYKDLKYQKDFLRASLDSCLNEQNELEKNNENLNQQLNRSQKENANLGKENKELKMKLDELQKKVVNLESKNNKTKADITETNPIGMKRSNSVSILAKANKLKIEFNQIPGRKPALENGNMKQI